MFEHLPSNDIQLVLHSVGHRGMEVFMQQVDAIGESTWTYLGTADYEEFGSKSLCWFCYMIQSSAPGAPHRHCGLVWLKKSPDVL